MEWALTPEEAVASVRRRLPHVVLAREEFLETFLRHVQIPNVPVIALLEPDGFRRRDRWFELGVTGLVPASARGRILELMAELAGLRMEMHPRVPYGEVVDVLVDGERHFLEAATLSTAGVEIRDFPAVALGTTCEITLAMMDPPYTFVAMVTRHVPETHGSLTGVAFTALSEEERSLLDRTVQKHHAMQDPLPEPVGLTTDLSGSTFTLDLFSAMEGEADNDRYHEILRDIVQGRSEKAPRWLRRVRRHLTELEERALTGGDAPDYAAAALDMRIDLARSRAFSLTQAPSPKEVELCLDFCRALAIDSLESDARDLGQVAEIRAALLREIYGAVSGAEAEEVPASVQAQFDERAARPN